MKAVLHFVLLHIVLPAAFLVWATGIYNVATQSHGPDRLDLYRTFTKEELSALQPTPSTFQDYADSVTASLRHVAKNQPDLLVDHYFYNLKQIYMFHVAYHDYMQTTDSGRWLTIRVHNFEMEIVAIRDNEFSLGNGRATVTNLYVNHRKTFGDYVTESTHKYFPLVKADDERRAKEPPTDMWRDILLPILKWLRDCYARGLPLASILFLFWELGIRGSSHSDDWYVKEWAKTSPCRIQPISLLFAIMIWPIVLGIDIFTRFQETVRKVEIVRRRSKLLSLFTEQEDKLLELGKHMSIREFRTHLDNIGMTKRHSMTVAVLATVFMLSFPRMLAPGITTMTVTITAVVVSPDHDVGDISCRDISLPEADIPSIEPVPHSYICATIFHFVSTTWKTLTGFPPGRDGVPKNYSMHA